MFLPAGCDINIAGNYVECIEQHLEAMRFLCILTNVRWQLHNRTSKMFVQTIQLFLDNKRKITSGCIRGRRLSFIRYF